MSPDHAIDAIVAELRRLRREGIESITLQSGRLNPFRDTLPVQSTSKPPTEPSPGQRPTSETADRPDRPVRRSAPASTPSGRVAKLPEAPPSFEIPADLPPDGKLDWLRARVLDCEVCQANLNPGGQIVFGSGPSGADIFFCGEAPGAEEERSGEPFVGPAGELLTKMIQAMGLQRQEVFIGNILKWRPQTGQTFGNRPPTAEEMAFCMPYLRAQIEIVRPKVIVALGATAATALLGRDEKVRIGSLRGTWGQFDSTPVLFTYHPSFILHNGTLQRKREIWEDLLSVMEHLGLPITEKQRGFFLPAD